MLDPDESPLVSKMNWDADDDKKFIVKRQKASPSLFMELNTINLKE